MVTFPVPLLAAPSGPRTYFGRPKIPDISYINRFPGPDASGLAEVRTVYPTYLLTLSLSIYGWD